MNMTMRGANHNLPARQLITIDLNADAPVGKMDVEAKIRHTARCYVYALRASLCDRVNILSQSYDEYIAKMLDSVHWIGENAVDIEPATMGRVLSEYLNGIHEWAEENCIEIAVKPLSPQVASIESSFSEMDEMNCLM
jgi:hypothetical protein